VPYKGGSPAMFDLQGGRVTVMATSIGTTAGMIKQGKIRAIAVTGAKRAGALPDIPTTAEQGIKGLEVSSWHALMAPAKVPQHLLVRLNKEAVRILGMPDVQDKLRSEGGEPSPMSLEDSAKFIQEEVARWKQALQGADIAID
jgi:tripartite-type tricarboxylate transporter receptor subunit TctC